MDKEKKLGGLKKKGRILESIAPEDKIIIFTNLGKSKTISFIAYTMVDEKIGYDESLYKTFLSPKKLKLKGIKYFQNPIVAKDMAYTLDFVENKERSANYYDSEFREISHKDFMNIVKGTQLDKKFPPYLKDISFSLDDFIKQTITIFYKNHKTNKKMTKRQIKILLKDIKSTLKGYGINVYVTDLEKFYAEFLNKQLSDDFKISENRESSLSNNNYREKINGENNNSTKYWIHKFPFDFLKELDKKKILAGLKKKGKLLDSIGVNDEIIIFSNFNNTINFIASTKVGKVLESDEKLYKTFHSIKKLILEDIKYFSKPIITRDLASKLSFVENMERNANYYKSEFKEINKKDFITITKKISLDEKYPFYLRNVSFSLDDFIEYTIKILFNDYKSKKDKNQIEIKIFLKNLRNILFDYDVRVSPEYLETFYGLNAHKFGFKHNPSRDTDKSIFLYNSAGKGRRFSYISLID